MQFDHLMHWVPSLDAAVADYQALGFTVQPGGQHPGSGTHNAAHLRGAVAGKRCEVTGAGETVARAAGHG